MSEPNQQPAALVRQMEPIDLTPRPTHDPFAAELPHFLPSTKCANCGAKIPLTANAEANHHFAQQHKFHCPKRDDAADEQLRLIAEFEAQQKAIVLAARPWWKFW